MILNSDNARGGATIGILNSLETWESNVILNLRLWCDSPRGQAQVWTEYCNALPPAAAKNECHTFETLVRTIAKLAQRPLVRHDVNCSCMGADEGIFLHLIRTASEGHLNDAALIATLLVGPAQAERIALLAGQVGECARGMHSSETEKFEKPATHVVRLH